MAKKFSKECIANQNLLKETKIHGGADKLKDYYIQKGRMQERDKYTQILNFILTVFGPIITQKIANKIISYFEEGKKEKDSVSNNTHK